MTSLSQGRGRRQGQNAKDFQASRLRSLHPGARDSRAKGSASLASPIITQDDIFAPPQDSDESDGADSNDLNAIVGPSVIPSAPVPDTNNGSNHDDDDNDIDKSEIFRRPRNQAYSTKRSYSMANEQSGHGQFVRPPKRNQTTSYKSIKPNGPRLVPPPPKATVTGSSDDGFLHIPPSKTSQSTPSSKTEDENFVQPPPRATRSPQSKDEEFTDPLRILPPTSPASTKRHLAVKSDLEEYLDQEQRRQRIKGRTSKACSSGIPKKKRAITPETIFMLPPASSGLDHSADLPDENILHEDSSDSGINGSPSSQQEIRSSNTSVCSSQSHKCPICHRSLDASILETFKSRDEVYPRNRLRIRQQERLHTRHSKLDAEEVWQERSYPEISWNRMHQRLDAHETQIAEIIEETKPSYYRSKIRQELPARGRKTTTLAEEMKTGQTASKVLGYYGTRGQRAIGDWLLAKFSTKLKQKAKNADVKLAGGVGGFTQKVLIPELVQCLIATDMEVDPMMKDHAQSRANAIIKKTHEGSEDCLGEEKADLYTSVRAAAADAGISEDISELDTEERLPFLARFVAMDSAECGIWLSEEIADVVPIEMNEND